MKHNYSREAWLIDDGVVIHGQVTKRKFIPESFGCGFSSQEVSKRDIGKILFYTKEEAQNSL